MNIDLTHILWQLITVLVVALLTKVVKPWIMGRVSSDQADTVSKLIDSLVQAAEQIYGAGAGETKKDAVMKWAEEQGVTVTEHQVEAAVLRLHAAGLNSSAVHPPAEPVNVDNTSEVAPNPETSAQ